MQPQSQIPPSPPQGPPPGPPPEQAGAWTEEMIQQVAIETGFSPEQIKADIARTGATSPAELYPAVYQGTGIQPQMPAEGQTVAPGAVQGQPPTAPGPEGMAPPPMSPPMAAEGAMPESGTVEGIDPAVAQAMHAAMAPRSKYKRMK